MTSWYLPRLKVSRIRSATPQMKLTIWLWFKNFSPSELTFADSTRTGSALTRTAVTSTQGGRAEGRFLESVTPECFNRGPSPNIPPGFPLKACGNDGLWQCYQSPLHSKLRGIDPKEIKGKTERGKSCEPTPRAATHSNGRLGAFALLELFGELRNDLEDVADDAKVGVLKDRRFRILIDRDDELGGFHS